MLELIIRRFLYYPARLPRDAKPPGWVRGAREVFFASGDGTEIHALHWPAPADRPTILFFHGNAQTVFEWALIRDELTACDAGLFLVDYPGYGKSGGAPEEAALYAAAHGAYDWLTGEGGVAAEAIVVFGKSLGGGVATELAAARKVAAVVLESTFCSIPDVARKLFPMVPMGLVFSSERYDSVARVALVGAPVLVVHGTRDELIPLEQGEKLFAAAAEPKELYRVEGAGHNDVAVHAGPAYGLRLRRFLDTFTD